MISSSQIFVQECSHSLNPFDWMLDESIDMAGILNQPVVLRRKRTCVERFAVVRLIRYLIQPIRYDKNCSGRDAVDNFDRADL